MNGSSSAEALVGVGSRSRSRSTGDSHRSVGNVKVEIRRLLAEWDRLDCRRVVRNVAKWNGDVADLKSTLKLWYGRCLMNVYFTSVYQSTDFVCEMASYYSLIGQMTR